MPGTAEAPPARQAVTATGLAVERLGAALLVRGPAGASAQGAALATAVRPEPGRCIVVVDPLVSGAGPAELAAVLARALGEHTRLRLMVSGSGAPHGTGQRLADLLRADTAAPDGALLGLPGGSFFVEGPSGPGTWRHFAPGREPSVSGPRYPEPAWQPHLPPHELRSAGGTVAEPIPAGLWLHRPLQAHRRWQDVAFSAPPDQYRMAIVIGGPGEPAVYDREVAALTAALGPELSRHSVPVRHDQLGRDWPPRAPSTGPVCPVEGGILVRWSPGTLWPRDVAPWWLPDPALFAVIARTDGTGFVAGGATVTADELGALITASPGWDRRPVLLVTGEPPPGWVVQRLADRVGVAVIGGPWRGRFAAMRPRTPDGTPLPHRLGEHYPFDRTALTALTGNPLTGNPLTGATPTQPAGPPTGYAPTQPAGQTPAKRTGPTPTPPADARPDLGKPAVPAGTVLPGHRSTDEERRRFRNLPIPGLREHLTAAGRLLALRPGLRSGTEPGDVAVTDLAAVRVYLSPEGVAIDRALRSTDPAPVRPVAACITSGLRRLPPYRGVVLGCGEPPAVAERGAVLVERSFTSTTLDLTTDVDGDTIVLIWSTGGRRTGMVADRGSPERVIFAANTAFKVLGTARQRGTTLVFLRDSNTPQPPTPGLDDDDRVILASLEQAERALTRRP